MSDHPPTRSDAAPPGLSDLLRELIRRFPAARELVEQTRGRIVAEVRTRDGRIDRLDQERTQAQDRLRQVGISLLKGGLQLPPRASRPHREPLLVEPFRTLRNQDFLSLGQLLHERLGTHSAVGWQMLLTDSLFCHGLPGFIHGLLGRPVPAEPVDPAEENDLVREHRQEQLRVLTDRVHRESGQPVEPDVTVLFTSVIAKTLLLGWDLLTTTPPGWILLPRRGDAFDQAFHQTIPGRPIVNARVARVIFPGYVLRTGSDKVVEKAQVYTETLPAVAGETHPPSLGLDAEADE